MSDLGAPPRCVCKRPDCPVDLKFDGASHAIVMTLKDGGEQLMYVDANVLIGIIANCRRMLEAMVVGHA